MPSPSAAAPPDPASEDQDHERHGTRGCTPPSTSHSRRYRPRFSMPSTHLIPCATGQIHVPPNAPDGRIVTGGSHRSCVRDLWTHTRNPMQASALATQVKASLASLALTESVQSISDGVAWGKPSPMPSGSGDKRTVSCCLLRPSKVSSLIAGTPAAIGHWLPTPPLNAPGSRGLSSQQ